ncbi:MAG: acyltransferase [Defluviitaleaceae bacterium]|nr:acyltransferase [Defluviitaleaceae bacterium]
MKKYNSIDVLKIILAIFVVMIHTNPFLSVSAYLNLFVVDALARLAVPLFFMSSGFFLASKLHDFRAVLNYIKKIVLLYLIWSIIYLPINVYNIMQDPSFLRLYIQRFFFEGSYYILWFLPALAFGSILLYFLRNLSKFTLAVLCVVLFAVGSLGQSYYSLANPPEIYYQMFLTTRNGLFFALPFLGFGFIAKSLKFSGLPALVLSAASLIALGVEVFLARNLDFSQGNGMWFFVLPSAFFVFLWVKEIKLTGDRIYKYLRKLSTLVFLSHGLFIIAFAIIAPRLGIENSIIQFLLVLVPSFILSHVILKIPQLKFMYE